MSNLVSIPANIKQAFNQIVLDYNREYNSLGLYFFELCRCKSKRLLLVYRREQLWQYCQQPKILRFIEIYGYDRHMSLDDMLIHLQKRMESSDEFPHEIGIFLGYPLEDVQHFIAHKGSAYQICGEWKCYVDVVNAQRSFLCYKVCRHYCHTKLMAGDSFRSLVAKTA